MDKREILEKAIQKAVDGGWSWNDIDRDWPILGEETQQAVINMLVPNDTYRLFIFNHDFAKALWGDYNPDYLALLGDGVGPMQPPDWQYHIQQMVIAPDPIAYLGEHI